MMRGTKRRPVDRLAFLEQSCSRMYRGHFENVIVGQGRKNPRECASEHRFPGARRAVEYDIVTAGGGDFKSALRALLPFHILEVKRGWWQLRAAIPHETRQNSWIAFSASGGQMLQKFRKRAGCINSDTFCKKRFARISWRDKNYFGPVPLRGKHLR